LSGSLHRVTDTATLRVVAHMLLGGLGRCRFHVSPASEGLSVKAVIPLPAGHGQGTVAPRTRENSGDSERARDSQSSVPARLLTFGDVATRCSVSVWTVRAWVDAGKLPVLRLPGRLVRIRPDDLARFLEGCR
jgi:excisionase family DNA binding protein